MTSHAWIDEPADTIAATIEQHVQQTFRHMVADEEDVARLAVARGHGYAVIVGSFGQRTYLLHPAVPRWSRYDFPTVESYQLWHESVTNPRKDRRHV